MRLRTTLAALSALVFAASGVSAGAETAKPVRIGLMADFTGLPFLVADQEGFFAAQGVKAEFKIFRSAVERDAALQAGTLDGTNADVVALISNRNAGFDLKVVASAQNRFSLLAGPAVASQAKKAGRAPRTADLAGSSIGLSTNTVIEYVVDTLMASAGVSDYRKTDVARIPVRLELLSQGKLDAASLPLPFDELAAASGCAIVADSVSAGLDPDLFMFFSADLAARPAEHRAVWKAVDAARALIAKTPDKYRPLLSERLGFSEDQARTVVFPAFPKYAPTGPAEIARVSAWMIGKGLMAKPAAYADLVASGILP